jgi:hypothetical protein
VPPRAPGLPNAIPAPSPGPAKPQQPPGDGFVTDPALIARHGLSDPRPFFNELLARPYASRVLLGPHLYPPSISDRLIGSPAAGGKDLYDKLAASWGGLAREGYCAPGGRCVRFPVVVGGSTVRRARACTRGGV